MRILNLDAVFWCSHLTGRVDVVAGQRFFTISDRPVLAAGDHERRPVRGCVTPPPNKPCTVTLTVHRGYSSFVRVGGRRVALSSLQGLTDGTQLPAEFEVKSSGQGFVRCSG